MRSGALTTLEAVERWFFANGPYWIIRYQNNSTGPISRNNTVNDFNESWDKLERALMDLLGEGRALLEITAWPEGKANNAVKVDVILRDVDAVRGAYLPAAQPAGIGNLPAGVGNIEQYIQEKVERAMMEREIQDLRAQINAPVNWAERLLDTVANSPQLAGIAQTLVAGLFAKTNPELAARAMQAVNGLHNQQPARAEHDTDDTANDQEIFEQNIYGAANALGTDPVTLAVRLNALIQQNPDMARQLLQTAAV